jgi:predicted nucleotidyltransferase component of viral defense system
VNQFYIDAARLLIQVAPAIFESGVFALKGGTAVNLFVRDMPRLSVDLDLVFPNYSLQPRLHPPVIRTEIRRPIAFRLKARPRSHYIHVLRHAPLNGGNEIQITEAYFPIDLLYTVFVTARGIAVPDLTPYLMADQFRGR